jgi:mannose-6-phosphate isomerase-like protein (cupin superfamily)
MPTQFKIADALKRLPTPDGKRFVELFKHGSLTVELYAPRGIDPQTPHARDEIYVIASGTGTFRHAQDDDVKFEPGDVLFVAAGVEHRFKNFTDDFAAWVFFYGPEGGEKV